ncbi:hypothetical protein L6250_03095 [Candidatus Parcubacteria bacterium]|nr:hypothetical protein [Patescibacteria group bacterium]MBU4466863.1 hypothetical protein [Patescibacteria group bacterium]MCG2688594.1 hypothetical protein [Candidatus Parcubacteria bacterium]
MIKPDETRKVSDLKDIVFDKSCLINKDSVVYKVDRGIKYKDGLRYDETLIKPDLLGKEFPKTKGHEHPKQCLELIKVIKGEALFLLQYDDNGLIEDIYFIKAKAGQSLISPFGYSHTTINNSRKELVIGTWMDDNCSSDYNDIKKFKGFGYYYTVSGWKKNKSYNKVPKLRQEKPLKSNPKNISFLKSSCC